MLARWAGSPRPHSSGKCCSLSFTLGHPHDEEPGQTVTLKVHLASVALDQVQTHKPYTVTFDLADPGAIAGAASEILQCFGHVDVLINNAGISYRGAIVDTSPDVDKRVMETNYFGPVALTKGKFLGQKGEVPGQVGLFSFPVVPSSWTCCLIHSTLGSVLSLQFGVGFSGPGPVLCRCLHILPPCLATYQVQVGMAEAF